MITQLRRELSDWFGPQEMAPAHDDAAPAAPSGDAGTKAGGRGLCYVVEDEAGIRHFLSKVLRTRHVEVREFDRVPGIAEAVAARSPRLIFLDVTLDNSDAVEAIRALTAAGYKGPVQLMSGRGGSLLHDIQRIGERHGLTMLPALQKPLHLNTIVPIVDRYFAATGAAQQRIHVPLREVLKNNWLTVWYQPKFDIKRMRVVGMEALARANHPEHGLLLPGAFMPGAGDEELTQLTEQVLIRTLNDWPALYRAGGPLMPAVNVPVNVMLTAPIAAWFRQHVPNEPGWKGMIMELTESQILSDVALAEEIATQFRIYNIKLSIDDFGEGFSTFSRLKAASFAEIKIDRKFVHECTGNPTNQAICESVINLAHRLGCGVVAEGVEREADLRTIFQIGCDLVQGHLLAAPMSKDRFETILAQGRDKAAVRESQQKEAAQA